MSIFDKAITVHEHAAIKTSEAQHAKGVTVRMNPRTFKTEYINPDGSIIPDFNYFLNQERV